MDIVEELFDQDVEIPSMTASMLNHGFPRFMEAMLSNMVWDHREKIHDVVDAIIAQRQRVEGKGRLKKSVAGRTTAPEYTLRHPKVTPTAAQLRHTSFTAQPSRSEMEDILERRNGISTYGRQWEDARKACTEAVQRIIDEGRRRKLKYFDESFYFDRRENMYPDGTPADCSVAEPKLCARLQEMFPNSDLFLDNLTPDDITQGEVGDCFFIGAVSALASSDPEHIRDLFIHHDKTVGVYGLVFYKCGGWEWVVVDDLVPYVKERSGGRYPLYASSTGENIEMWPIILEKAYAKLHYNWSTVDGGWAKEALIDMTGGVATTLDFTQADSELSFEKFSQMVGSKYTVCACAVPESVKETAGGAAGRAGETSALFGLFKGHQYAVIDAKLTSDGTGFVKCRNPWGNDAEWRGPYSDGSVEWTRNLKHKREINPTFADDGEFWMKFTDFKKYLGIVDVVTTYPDEHNIITMFGAAAMDMTAENTYVLQVSGKAADLAVTLTQDDPKIKFGKEEDHASQLSTYASLKFTIYKMKEIPNDIDEVRDHMQGKINSKVVRERSTSLTQRLEPGAYVICPTAQYGKGTMSEEDLGIYLRVIGPADANFSLHRPYDRKRSERQDLDLMVGMCPSIDDAKGRGPEVLKLLARSFGSPLKAAANMLGATFNGGASISLFNRGNKAVPSAGSGGGGGALSKWENASAVYANPEDLAAELGAIDADTEQLRTELTHSKAYAETLKALLERQQEQIDALHAQVAAAEAKAKAAPTVTSPASTVAANASVTSPPSPTPPPTSAGAYNRPKNSGVGSQQGAGDETQQPGTTAWDRLKMSKARLEELINIVFMELGGGKDLSVEDAVNGVRLLVTTGTGLDDIAYAHPLCMQAATGRVDVGAFATLCNDSIMQWGALAGGAASAASAASGGKH